MYCIKQPVGGKLYTSDSDINKNWGEKKVCLYLALVTVKLFPECVVDVHAICMTAVDKQNYCREVIRGRSDREHFFAVSRLFPVVFFGQSAFYVLLMHPWRLRV